ncbi:murein biosynthesis integral membrane protein MurJ [Curtobacterium flaccumfaciens pv. betae]|uniref:murein biosynthesis integral membrane protein MurJ n=1 Tax=Curtobacterium flaccumfaciens TaxID=2035 RepID=UPI002658763B|nr:murein biosynthesis integral membrane protein MurJ [Curtobacterium flaccumfaciens]MCS5468002.1 murein biosynthesis integral membrane protein MurJ [Curtobacterium flaccumfaciens pv. betae]
MQMLRTTLAAAASTLVALGLVVAPVATDHASASTTSAAKSHVADPAAADAGKATISIAPANRGVVQRDQDLTLSVTVTNDTDAALPAGTADFRIFRSVSTRDVLAGWLADTTTTGYLGAEMDSVDIPAIPAHRSVSIDSVDIVSGNVALGGYPSFGARRIAAEYTAGDAFAVDRSAITWYPDFEQAPVSVSVAMPVTVPKSTDGVLTAPVLAAATSVDGTLTQQLDAAEDHNVAVAVDPRIIASIRLLGDNAPSSATTWLQRLEALRNETFALSYADADVTGLRQAGSDGILSPISLDQSVESENFPGAETPAPTPTATPGQTSSPAPTETSTDGATTGDAADQAQETLPTTESLLDFPYSMDSIAWPTEGTVSSADLPALERAGTKTTIVSSGNTSAGADTTITASEKIGDDHVLVSDQSMSSMLRRAAAATDRQTFSSAMSELTATLATSARAATATGPILLTLGREWPSDSTRLSQALDALESTAWVAPADLSTASKAVAGSLTLASASTGEARIDQLRRLVRGEQGLSAFATILDDPNQLTAPARLRLLALASNAWRDDDQGLAAAVEARTAAWAKTTTEVGIVDSSSLTLLGDRSSLPVSIRNSSDYPVTVHLSVQPSNSALRVVRNDIVVEIQPDSSTRATVPVQSVANGKVELTMSLSSPTGVAVAQPATVELNVQAQWETVITAVAAIALIGIFGFGIFRSIRKRIRRRNGELDDEDDDDPNRPLAVQPTVGGTQAATTRPGGTDHPSGAAPAPSVAASTAGVATAAPAAAVDQGPLHDAIARAGAEPGLPSDAARSTVADDRDPEEPTISASQPQPDVDAEPVAERSLGRASAMLAAGTMLSRILGFAKTFVLAYAIGQTQSPAADAFAVSNQLPNNIYALIAGGLLSAVLIPQIVRAMKQHTDGGTAYVNKIVTLGGSLFIVIALVATLIAPLLVQVYAQTASGEGKGFTPGQIDLAVAFAFWCLPQILFYAMYSLLGEVLNAKQVFGPFTWAPLINNVISIAGLVVFIAMFGGRAANSGVDDWTPLKIAVLAGSATLGVLAQAAFLPFFWRRTGLSFRPDFRWRGVGLKSTGTAAGWLFAMILVTQLAGIVQSRVASLGSGAAGNAVLQNAWLLFMLPHSIITVSIATAYFTRMSHDAERGDLGAVRKNLSLSLRIVGLFTVFASIALMVVAVPFGRMFSNTFDGALSIGAVLLAYMPGLVLFSMLFIIQRVFWAMHDHRTPFLMQCVQSVLFVIGALAVTTLPNEAIGVAIAACTTLAGTAQTIVALVLVRKRLGGIEGPVVTRSHVQFVIAALIAGVAGLLVVNFFGSFSASGFAMADFTGALITLVLAGAVMAAVYFGALVVAKNGEIGNAVRLLRSKLGR